MRWKRLLACVLTAAVLGGLSSSVLGRSWAGAQEPSAEQEQDPASEEAAPAEAAAEEPGDPESSAESERKAMRKAKRDRRAGGEQEEASAKDEAQAPESDGEVEAESDSDSESNSDADLPGLLVIETDAESDVYVAGVLEGRIAPGDTLEVGVELGEITIRAASVEHRTAIWEKTVELAQPGSESVRIRMLRTMRVKRREERATGIFRDPKSRLMWPKRDNGSNVDLRRAYAYCRDLGIGGLDGWRLPTLAELESLQAIWERGIYKIRGGILLTECCMWSSEYDGSERAWTFNFRFRKAFRVNAGYELGLRALCVREWPESEQDGTETPEED